jgi:hypothetical protein
MPVSSERISLVDFATRQGIERLEAAIQLADVIKTVDTQVKYVFFNFLHSFPFSSLSLFWIR